MLASILSDNRESPRFPLLNQAVEFRIGPTITAQGYLSNISETGLFLETHNSLFTKMSEREKNIIVAMDVDDYVLVFDGNIIHATEEGGLGIELPPSETNLESMKVLDKLLLDGKMHTADR